jgi:glycosyltransferase involved in cell wall biosynthesis
MGHKVKGVCLSYRKRKEGSFFWKSVEGEGVEWVSFNVISSFLKYLKYLHHQLCHSKPDVILASSDCFHIIWGVLLGKAYRVPCVVDLYDNYEFYKLSKFPGIILIYRLFLRKADAISCVSKPLKKFLVETCQPQGEIQVIGNAVDKTLFYPRSMADCRKYFGLSKDITIIGTGGALDANRGINNLYRAFESLAEDNPHIYLVVAGVGNRDDPVFDHLNVVDLGILPYEEMSLFFNVLDVAVICNQSNGFGQYCFPQKAYEILACKTAVISADIGVMSDLFKDYPECLFNPESETELVDKVNEQLKRSSEIDVSINTWIEQAEKFERLINKLVKQV